MEQLPEHKLWEDFTDKKYGNYYRNFHGIIEHSHYHLGQIVLIKKILLQQDENLRILKIRESLVYLIAKLHFRRIYLRRNKKDEISFYYGITAF